MDILPRTARVYTLAHTPVSIPRPEDLVLASRPIPALASGQILVANAFFSIDAALRIRMTPMDEPYMPPLHPGDELDGWAAGHVVASRAAGFTAGDAVFHARGWRDYAVVDTEADAWTRPRVVPEDPGTPLQSHLAELGPSGLTAWAGLRRVAQVREGDVVYVSAAAGAAGGLAVQIARRLGRRVIGSAGSAAKARHVVEELGADAAFCYRDEEVVDALGRLAPEGVDVYFDNVGGAHLEGALEAMRPGGRIALCGAVGEYNLPLAERSGIRNLFRAVERGLTLRGFLARMHVDAWEDFRRDMACWRDEGCAVVSPLSISDGLEAAPEAFIRMLTGATSGKTVVSVTA